MALLDRFRRKAMSTQWDDEDGDVGRSDGMGHYIEWVPTEHLRPMLEWDRDENGIPGRTDEVLDSLNRVGFKNPVWIDFNDQTRMAHLSEGNHRVTVALRAGIPAVPVSVIRSGRVPRNQSILRPYKYVGGEVNPYDPTYVPQYMKPSEIGMPTTEPWTPPKTSARIAMPIVPINWDVLNQPRDEYVGEFPSYPGERDDFVHSKPAYTAWREQAEPEYEAHRQREKDWDRAARHAMAIGRMTPEQVTALGYRAISHEMDTDWGAPAWGKWQPLPPKLYHATTNLPAILQSGVLRSPHELDLMGQGRGLGGGTQDTISLTDSLDEAQNMKRAMIEGADVASGRLPIERLVEMAKTGEGANRPWLNDMFRNHDWSKGNPQGLDDLLLGRKPFYNHLLPEGHPLKGMESWQGHLPEEEWAQHGYYPREGAYPLGTPGNPDYPRYTAQHVYRNLTPEEKAIEAFEWWRNPWATFRSSAGGPSDPIFTGIDPHWFAKADTSHVGVLELEPKTNAHGYPLSSLGEWRVPTGEGLNIVGHDGQQHTAAAAPDPGLLMEAWHVYNETNSGAPAKSGLPAEQELMRRMEGHGRPITEAAAKQALLDAMDMWFRGEGEGGAWEGWNAQQAIEDTIMDSPHYVPNIGQPTPRQGASGSQRSWHLTDRHDFALDPEYHPENNTTLGGDWPHKGLFVGEPEKWFNGHDYVRPFVAEIEHPPLESFGGYSGENFLPAEAFPHSIVRRVIPYSQYQRETFGGSYDEALDAPDGDVRQWRPEQVAAYKQKLNEYIKSSRPHMLQSVCERCGSDYVSPGKPCPKCGFATDWDGNVYSRTASFPGPEYLVPGQRYTWWSPKSEQWRTTGEPRNFNPSPHITWATYLGPHRHEDYQRAVPEIPTGHQFQITQGGYDGRAKMVRATKDDPSDPHAATWEQFHVMDDAQLRDVMERGAFEVDHPPDPEFFDRVNMQAEDQINRDRDAQPMTMPEDWSREGSVPDTRPSVNHISGETTNQELRRWNDLESFYAELAEDDGEPDYSVDDPHPVVLHRFPDGWTVQHHPSQASAQMVGGFMRNCWQGADMAWQAATPSSLGGAQFAALHDEHGLPRAAFYWHPQRRIITQPLGMRNDPLTPDLEARLEAFKQATPDNGRSVKSMAERSGFPELDQAIDEFMRSHPDIESYRDPQNAWGQCEVLAEECAAFLKQRGFKAYAAADELGAFPGYENAQDTKEIGAGDFAYPEHAMVEVYGLYGPNNVNNVTIDFTASQYGFTEFPKVHGGPADRQSFGATGPWGNPFGGKIEADGSITRPGEGPWLPTPDELQWSDDEEARQPSPGRARAQGPQGNAAQGEEVLLRGVRARELRQSSGGDANPPVIPEHPEFPDLDDAIEAHDEAVDASGQPSALLSSPDHLESALGRAEHHWYYGDPSAPAHERLFGAAAALGHGVAQAQAFEDGNKRTAYWLMYGLLDRNGLGHVLGGGANPWDDPEMATIVNGWGEGTHERQHLVDLWKQRHESGGPRQANILDPVEKTLDPAVFDQPEAPRPRLKPAQREWLLDTIYNILEQGGYEGADRWARLYLTGSLTTYQYAGHSDCDISIFVNHHVFPEWSRAEMIGLMVDHCDGLTLPGTPHELQVFVVAKGIEPEDLYQRGLRSGYDLINEEWVVPPERERTHDVEHEDPEGYATGLLAADKMERLLRYEPDKAITYYGQLHRKRMRDQKDAKGDFAGSNLIYKMLDNRGLFDQLRELGVKIASELD